MIGWNDSQRIRMFVVLGVVFSLLCVKSPTPSNAQAFAAPQAPECQGGVGGRIFSNGGELEVEILPALAGFTSELSFFSPGPLHFIGTNHDTGTIVKLGTVPAGVELIFSIYVRETQRTFYSGPGYGNPDGLGHGEVTCFGGGRSRIGFEDQMGGGDRNYADLICEVRQPLNTCTYSVSPLSQSFDSGGGGGTVRVAATSGCSWSASANVNWIAITSGGSGSADGTINYSVAANTNTDSRSGTISIPGRTFTVFQDGSGSAPLITSTSRSGKDLVLFGLNFDSGSVILLNGEKMKTLHDDTNPRTILIGKKLYRWAVPGDKLQVRTSTGVLSAEFTYTP